MELKIQNITKRYRDKTAVDDVSITLTPGVWGLLGANGAGKTTLMRMLAGIVAAVGLRPKRSESRCFYGMNPLRQSRKALTERVQSSTGSSFMPNNFSESRGSRCCN